MKETLFISLGLSTIFSEYTGMNAFIQPLLIKTNIEVTAAVLDLVLKTGEILVAYITVVVLTYKVYGYFKGKRSL
jgi:hypothetical protein